MAKSKRSKVKMAYKAMRRRVMEPANDKLLRRQAERVYSAVGLTMPEERSNKDVMKERTHGGLTIVTNFHPTESGPKLNVVHGPLAQVDPLLQLAAPVIGLPMVGAGLTAHLKSDHPKVPSAVEKGAIMEVAGPAYSSSALAGDSIFDKPYFYPRRTKNGGVTKRQSVRKSCKNDSRHRKNNLGIPFI
jgi:hypothetical protein